MLTAEQLQDVKERADKATPGEWLINVHYDENGAKEGTCDIHTNNEPVACYTNEYDAQFIAHARQDIPELLQQVASLQDEYERMKQSRNHWHRVAVGRRMATTESKGRLDRTELAEAKARMENERLRELLEISLSYAPTHVRLMAERVKVGEPT